MATKRKRTSEDLSSEDESFIIPLNPDYQSLLQPLESPPYEPPTQQQRAERWFESLSDEEKQKLHHSMPLVFPSCPGQTPDAWFSFLPFAIQLVMMERCPSLLK